MPELPQVLSSFITADLKTGANALLASLGYTSDKTEQLNPPTAASFASAFGHTFSKTAHESDWQRIELLFQLTGDELAGQISLLSDDFNRERFESFLFFAVDLKEGKYSRTKLADMAREINKPFPAPVIVLFRHGQTATLASLHRRENKRDSNKDVLERVVLLKDINLEKPHRAHLDILRELQDVKEKATSWKGFLAEWNRVLDISELNRKFYRDYKLVFDQAEKAALLPEAAQDKRREWTQRLFNRLLFLRFLEKKHWLEFEGSENYLRSLFEKAKSQGQSFLNDRLYFAFFHGLNTVREDAQTHGLAQLEAARGKVPFLNGGLFDLEDALDAKDAVRFENENTVFESILGLFERYYFTVDESTPLEEEVGIDPEMLGKVFEELVTGRHESGSYYTPRGIVSFMGREALKGYLSKTETPEAAARLVDFGDATLIADPERVLAALREVTVCDPACGSGAYLLGMMQELLRLREALFVAKAKDHRRIYDRKLEIIAQNLYGVDKDPFAVSIAKLRLWLSLIIEFEGATPPPLPNLKYKIESGDSLAAPLGNQLTLDADLVSGFNDLKREYVKAHGERKAELESQIEEKRAQLKVYSSAPEGAHDWRTEFAEVFENGGFDVVVANPPYVRMELFKDQKPRLKVNFSTVHTDRADLYIYFYARAHELLNRGGMLAFISPQKWFRAAYGARLRSFLASNAVIHTIVDFGDLKVFENADAYPMIFLAQKAKVAACPIFAPVRNLNAPYPDVRAIVIRDGFKLPENAIKGSDWKLIDANDFSRLESMHKSSISLNDFIRGQIYYGIKTGLNEAFIIDGSTREMLIKKDPRCKAVIKSLLAGKDVQRWVPTPKDRWIIYMHHGISTEGLSAIIDHLRPYREQLESRATKQNWYELQQPQMSSVPCFENDKIVYPQIMSKASFALDIKKSYTNQKCFVIGVPDLFLLGVMNSSSFWGMVVEGSPILRGGYSEPRRNFLLGLPVPTPSGGDKVAIESLVDACLKKSGQNCQAEEAEINARVAKLYGL